METFDPEFILLHKCSYQRHVLLDYESLIICKCKHTFTSSWRDILFRSCDRINIYDSYSYVRIGASSSARKGGNDYDI